MGASVAAVGASAVEEVGGATSLLAPSVLFVLLVLLFTAVAARLSGWLVTAPVVFVVAGAIVGFIVGPVESGAMVNLRLTAEVTLVLILFHDAAQVRPRQLGAEKSAVARLLLVGFPLTVALGYFTARWLFPDLPAMLALLLAAALAPTDAGLGAATVLNPVVPARVRRLLNVESGLNDGLATPIVLFAIAVAAGVEGTGPGESLVQALADLTIGVAAGTLAGASGALLLGASRAAALSTRAGRALGVLMVPLLAYGVALLADGNGFVAAFISGTVFAGVARWTEEEPSALALTEELSDPLGYLVWIVFGFSAVPFAWHGVGPRELGFAILALTVLRMGPVALSLVGTHLRWRTIAFIGWFGPRGLATVIFGILALEALDIDDDLRSVVATMSIAVLLSVVAHGFSAEPLARRYGAFVQRSQPEAELGIATEPRSRAGGRRWVEDLTGS